MTARSRAPLAALLITVAVAAPGFSPASGAPAQAVPVSSLATLPFSVTLSAWSDCSESEGIDGLTCAWLDVPLDYQHPEGDRIRLRVSRIDHTSPEEDYKGFIVLNPGGPSDGVWTPLFSTFLPYGAGDYDWVGFDPRGVAQSRPRLSCDTEYFGYHRPPYVPETRALMRYWLDKTDGYAEACARSPKAELLPHLSTRDIARDLESLRVALHAERPSAGPKLNFYGLSYGTYIGQVYATMHPRRVGRFVLDGVMNPRRIGWAFQLDQDRAFQIVINKWFRWIARHDDVYHLGADGHAIRAAYYRKLDRLADHPAVGGLLGPTEFQDATVAAGYLQLFWPDLAAAYSRFMRHEGGRPLLGWASSSDEPTDDSAYAAYNSVLCTDTTAWPGWKRLRKDSWRVHQRAPWGTWSNTWYIGPCREWPAPHRDPVEVTGEITAKILLVSETFDAATPYHGALKVRSIFPTARLIEGVGGTTHAGSLLGVACVDNAIAAYLATGEVPARKPGKVSDLRCPPVRAPVPERGAARTAGPSDHDHAWLRYRAVRPTLPHQ